MSTIAEKYAGAPMTIETYVNMYADLVEICIRKDEDIKFQKQRIKELEYMEPIYRQRIKEMRGLLQGLVDKNRQRLRGGQEQEK